MILCMWTASYMDAMALLFRADETAEEPTEI